MLGGGRGGEGEPGAPLSASSSAYVAAAPPSASGLPTTDSVVRELKEGAAPRPSSSCPCVLGLVVTGPVVSETKGSIPDDGGPLPVGERGGFRGRRERRVGENGVSVLNLHSFLYCFVI